MRSCVFVNPLPLCVCAAWMVCRWFCLGCSWCLTGATVPVGIHPSKVQITKLKINGNRQALLDRKNRDKSKDAKAKFSEAEVNDVD